MRWLPMVVLMVIITMLACVHSVERPARSTISMDLSRVSLDFILYGAGRAYAMAYAGPWSHSK